MADINGGYVRRVELHCTPEEHDLYANKILFEGETLYVKQTDGTYAIKIGDGVTKIGALPYAIRSGSGSGGVSIATFDVVDGNLVMTTPDDYSGVQFTLTEDGRLEVNI